MAVKHEWTFKARVANQGALKDVVTHIDYYVMARDGDIERGISGEIPLPPPDADNFQKALDDDGETFLIPPETLRAWMGDGVAEAIERGLQEDVKKAKDAQTVRVIDAGTMKTGPAKKPKRA